MLLAELESIMQNGDIKPASPTIREIFDRFLLEERASIEPKSYSHHAQILQLFTSNMNNYACQSLGPVEKIIYRHFLDLQGSDHREFCDIFGPDKIWENINEFVNYFMPKKVMAPKVLLRTMKPALTHLAQWLTEIGFPPADNQVSTAISSQTVDLVACQDLLALLTDFVDKHRSCTSNEQFIHDHFRIISVGRTKIGLQPTMHAKKVSLSLPPRIISKCQPGWTISMEICLSKNEWHIREIYSIIP